jgi:predicted Zn-dependent protease with MMP-like domain
MGRKAARSHISSEAFARLVRQAIRDLPPPYARLMETIAVVLKDLEIDSADDLLGLYQGESLSDNSFFKPGGTPPAQISIYRGPILRLCETPEEVVREVYDTVLHELGHHVGLQDDEMPY